MRLNCAIFLLLLGILGGSQGAILQRPQRDVQTLDDAVTDAAKDQIPVAVIEVQEPDTVVQSLQVDTAIDNAEAETEQELEFKEPSATDQIEIDSFEHSTEPAKLEADIEFTTENELKKGEFLKSAELQQRASTVESTVEKKIPIISQDQILEPTEIVTEKQEVLAVDTSVYKEPVTDKIADADADPEGRQNTPSAGAESTTPQNFVQFIQNTPIGQFFTQLTGGQQQQQQSASQAPAGAAADAPQPSTQVPGFLNPGVALTQAQQAVQSAAQSVVNTTTQAIQGLQQFATNIGTQFQSTISSLSGQNQQQQQNVQQDATTARPPGPIQAIVSNFVGGGNQAAGTTNSPGPFQGIISFFQGGQRPTVNSANQGQNQASPNQEKPNVDDKIETQEPEITNEVRNSEESLDSFEESQSGQDLIVVNDDAGSLATEQTSNA